MGISASDPGPFYRPAPDAGVAPACPDPLLTMSAHYEGVAGLRAYREVTAGTCAISALADPRGFRVQGRVHHLGSTVLAELHSSSLRYLRSARHVVRGAYDHYQITFNLSGHIHYRSGRHSASVRPEDIAILDSAREADAYVHAPDQGSAHALTLFVPRAALAPLLRAPDGGHLRVVSREQVLARSLRDRLTRMLESIELETPSEVYAAAQDLIGLLAGSFGGGRKRVPAAREATHRSAADSLKRLIERRLSSPALSVELLCAHSGCSRATVYRLFETEGGPMRYIWQRRLERAFRELMTDRYSGRRIAELALADQFASDASFHRAFRRAFGIPPGEVRAIAARSRHTRLASGGRNDCAQAIDWIKTLGAAP